MGGVQKCCANLVCWYGSVQSYVLLKHLTEKQKAHISSEVLGKVGVLKQGWESVESVGTLGMGR